MLSLRFHPISDQRVLASITPLDNTFTSEDAQLLLDKVMQEGLSKLTLFAGSLQQQDAVDALLATPKDTAFMITLGHQNGAPEVAWGKAHFFNEYRVEFVDHFGTQRNFSLGNK